MTKKINEAQQLLGALGLPSAQQNEISALTLLALCGLKPGDPWSQTYKHSLTVSKGVMDFIAQEYKRVYAPNTRETVRRQVLHQFMQAYIIDYNPDDTALPTNSPRAHYAISESALTAIKSFGSDGWNSALSGFVAKHGKLAERYRKQRITNSIPIELASGKKLQLSPGKHNKLQVAVIHEFAPRFAPGSEILYLGDTANKDLHVDENKLAELGIPFKEHDKFPDIVLFDSEKNWLFLIEVVTSHGPMSPKRIVELEKMLSNCNIGKVFVTAFPNLAAFKRHMLEIAWETEVWLADVPDHMIHYNGDKFLGPR